MPLSYNLVKIFLLLLSKKLLLSKNQLKPIPFSGAIIHTYQHKENKQLNELEKSVLNKKDYAREIKSLLPKPYIDLFKEAFIKHKLSALFTISTLFRQLEKDHKSFSIYAFNILDYIFEAIRDTKETKHASFFIDYGCWLNSKAQEFKEATYFTDTIKQCFSSALNCSEKNPQLYNNNEPFYIITHLKLKLI